MPRNSGIYSLPSPPMPLIPNTLAAAEDINVTLSDIALALTNSVATDGSSPITGNLNMNGHSIGGVSTLSATDLVLTGSATIPRLYVTTSAGIAALHASLSANGWDITSVGTLGAVTGVFSGTVTAHDALITGGITTAYLTVTTGANIAALGSNLNANGQNISGAGTVQGNYLHSNGDGQIDGNLYVNGSASAGVNLSAPYLQGGASNAGTLRCWNTNNKVNFHWNSNSQLSYRVDEVNDLMICTQINAMRLNLTGGTGGPTGVSMNVNSLDGSLYSIYVDAVSDSRIKDNIANTEVDALAAIRAIPVRQYDVKAAVAAFFAGIGKSDEEQAEARAYAQPVHVPIGLVTQEVAAQIPDAVAHLGSGDNPDSPLPADVQSLINAGFTPYLLRAIQQLADRVVALEAR